MWSNWFKSLSANKRRRRNLQHSQQPIAEILEVRKMLAANLFVATTGNDASGRGTLNAPYATLRKAIAVVEAGDTVLLRSGTYTGGVRIDVPDVTIRSYGNEWAVVTAPTSNDRIETVIHFAANAGGGMVKRLEVVGGYYYGIKIDSEWNATPSERIAASGVIIADCRIHDTGRDAIKITPGCDNVIIQRNEIFNTGRRDNSNAEGIDNVNGDQMIVRDNHIHDIATNGVYAKGGAIGTLIERNLIRKTGGAGIMLGFRDTDAEWFDEEINPSYYESINGTVRNNIVVDTAYAGIGLYGAKNARVYNNTLANIAQSAQAAILIDTSETYISDNDDPLLVSSRNVTVSSNIIKLSSTSSRYGMEIRTGGLTGKLQTAANRYFHPGRNAEFRDRRAGSQFVGGLSAWKRHVAGEKGSSQGNPRLDGNLHLRAASPCIDAGSSLFVVRLDYDGNLRSGRIDIGADEAGNNGSLPVSPPAGTTGTGGPLLEGPRVRFATVNSSGSESKTSTRLAVTLSPESSQTVTVAYFVNGGTAKAGSDFQLAAGNLKFSPGQTTAYIPLTVANDVLDENHETLFVTLSNPSNAFLGSVKTHRYTIRDNDPLPNVKFRRAATTWNENAGDRSIPVQLSAPSGRRVSVPYVVASGTATDGSDYVLKRSKLFFYPGQTRKSIPISIIDDTVDEDRETVRIRLSSPTNGTLDSGTIHTLTIVDDDDPAPSVETFVTYRLPNGHVYRIAPEAGAKPVDVTKALDRLSPGTLDENLNVSPDGHWLALITDRFGIGSDWTGLAVVAADLSTGDAVRVNNEVVHPDGAVAVASGGDMVIYSSGDGPHVRDLWAATRANGKWKAKLLTSDSPYAYNSQPAISADGTKVLFDGGNAPYSTGSRAILEVRTDGAGFRKVVTNAHRPAGTKAGAVHHADYAPNGSIVFEAEWTGEQIWRLPSGKAVPVRISKASNENSPCVLPDGRIVSLWLNRPGNRLGVHELTVRKPNGSLLLTLLPNIDVEDIGISCGG